MRFCMEKIEEMSQVTLHARIDILWQKMVQAKQCWDLEEFKRLSKERYYLIEYQDPDYGLID